MLHCLVGYNFVLLLSLSSFNLIYEPLCLPSSWCPWLDPLNAVHHQWAVYAHNCTLFSKLCTIAVFFYSLNIIITTVFFM